MSRQRRTRAQKIIAQLRRQLQTTKAVVIQSEAKAKPVIQIPSISPKTTLDYDYHLLASPNPKKVVKEKAPVAEFYTHDSSFIKKDLFKTFYLSLLMFSLIGFCYWYFNFFK